MKKWAVLWAFTGSILLAPGQAIPEKNTSHTTVYFRAQGNYFQVPRGDSARSWQNLLLKGVNLGVALPGKFPGQFSLSKSQYRRWIEQIGAMNANVLRVYTILPPAFYQVLWQYNQDSNHRPLYLLQGVWAEAPEDKDLYNAAFSESFHREIRQAMDVLHGKAQLDPLPGKASGNYTFDVSPYLIGIILGREWEPDVVHRTNQKREARPFRGRYFSVNQGNATEVWLGQMLDYTAQYLQQMYQHQVPLSFVNWLPLDPMYHNTEYIENERIKEYDNDLESIDFLRIHAHPGWQAGLFASWHAYPYYPDFIYLSPRYQSDTNTLDHYRAYLRHLKAQHPAMPMVIAEYGLPSSRGNSHWATNGYSQGGHSEAAQAQKSMALTRAIFETGGAGALYFEWSDEWFKHNWLVQPFELPAERRVYWHNAENPEQNFGILAVEDRRKTIDGHLNDWPAASFSESGSLRYATAADATYAYLSLITKDSLPLHLALDLLPGPPGDHRLPGVNASFEEGWEFLVSLYRPDSALLKVDEPYSLYTNRYRDSVPDFRSVANNNGHFIRQKMLTNRPRRSLQGQKFPARRTHRGKLQYGRSDAAATSNADWYRQGDTLELRLPWHLLHITDPTQGHVLQNNPQTTALETRRISQFKGRLWQGKAPWQERSTAQQPLLFGLPSSDSLVYRFRKKPLYDSLQRYFGELPAPNHTAPQPSPSPPPLITPFYRDHSGALSVHFTGNALSQIKVGVPLLHKYDARATFTLPFGKLEEQPFKKRYDHTGRHWRMGKDEIKYLLRQKHQLALPYVPEKPGEFIAFYQKSQKAFGYTFPVLYTDSLQHFDTLLYRFPFLQKLNPRWQTTFYESGFPYRSVWGPALSDSLYAQILSPTAWLTAHYYHAYDSLPVLRDTLCEISKWRLERQIRLARNKNRWLAPAWDVFQYQYWQNRTSLSAQKRGHTTLLELHPTDIRSAIPQPPLTVKYYSRARYLNVSGGESPGLYHNRRGYLLLHARPGETLLLEEVMER